MPTNRTKPSSRIAGLAIVGALLLAATACSGGSSDGSKDDTRPTTDAGAGAGPNEIRPEGEWTFVRWQVSRTDDPGLVKGSAAVRVATLTPSCKTGACDLAVTPAGRDGSYLPEGTASLADDPPSTAPFRYRWSAKDTTYSSTSKPASSSCTSRDAKAVADAYTSTTKTELTFQPADAKVPALLLGTFTEHVVATAAGKAAGCASYEASWRMAGSPTRAFAKADDIDDLYVVTEVVSKAEPAGGRGPGFRGILFQSVPVTAVIGGHTIQDAKLSPSTVQLTPGTTGWRGTETSTISCAGPKEPVPQGASQVETWTDLHAVTQTADSAPILVGRWSVTATPNDTGTAGGCTGYANAGAVTLVPITGL